jgi:hypothetical protein
MAGGILLDVWRRREYIKHTLSQQTATDFQSPVLCPLLIFSSYLWSLHIKRQVTSKCLQNISHPSSIFQNRHDKPDTTGYQNTSAPWSFSKLSLLPIPLVSPSSSCHTRPRKHQCPHCRRDGGSPSRHTHQNGTTTCQRCIYQEYHGRDPCSSPPPKMCYLWPSLWRNQTCLRPKCRVG